jgi:hypothetical protein
METILVNVDSRFRDKKKYSNTGQFTLEQLDKIKNVKSVKLCSIELPNTNYYFLNSRLNTLFKIIMEEGNLGQIFNIELREGNYTNEMLIDFIQINYFDVINNLTVGLPSRIERYNFKIELQPDTNRVVITNYEGIRLVGGDEMDGVGDGEEVEVGGAKFKLDFSRIKETEFKSLGKYLGFLNLLYEGSNSYIGESIINTQFESYCYLRLNNYGILYNNVEDKRIIAKIPMDKLKNYVVYDYINDISKEYEFIQPVNIDKWEVEVIDLYGNIMDLKGQNVSMTVELKVIRNSGLYQDMMGGIFNTPWMNNVGGVGFGGYIREEGVYPPQIPQLGDIHPNNELYKKIMPNYRIGWN